MKSGNGLRKFGFHVDQRNEASRAIRPKRRELITQRPVDETEAEPGAEPLAREYLNNSFASEALPELTNLTVNGVVSEFSHAKTYESSLKETKSVHFIQTLNGVSVYGSLATVEFDEAGELVSINSALGEPNGVSSIPVLDQVEALESLRRRLDHPRAQPEVMRLSYYYQQQTERWHLAFIAEDVFAPQDSNSPIPLLADIVVDAHDGALIDILPRACAAQGLDALNRQRTFETSFDVVTAGQQLRNTSLNILTQDFGFQDVGSNFTSLPGQNVNNPPLPWNPMAISAHANAEVVALFLQRNLDRRGVDGHGGPMTSSINCVWSAMGSNGRDWPNSFWIKNQVVYGQRQSTGFRSFAAALDMVGHEFFHGVIQFSARLDFKGQTGALNESLSDIFGVMIANDLAPDWDTWNWQIGADTGQPLRDMSNPGRFNHPMHMSEYRDLPVEDDFGGVHSNCGIHNKAAFTLMTSRDSQGEFLFVPMAVAQLFYHTVLGLAPTAQFIDCRNALDLQARTIFRDDPRQDEKLDAIGSAYSSVGI